MSFEEQLKLVRGTNVLVGVHGAGLMFTMFAAEEVRTCSILCHQQCLFLVIKSQSDTYSDNNKEVDNDADIDIR